MIAKMLLILIENFEHKSQGEKTKLPLNSIVMHYIETLRSHLKGELRPEISLLHMKVLTLIKAKSNVFL